MRKGESLERKELAILRLLKEEELSPADLSLRSKLALQETQSIAADLIRKHLILKKSDGFSSILYITQLDVDALRGST